MRYVALLRGINVGGNRKVDMSRLRATFEALGMENVRTYINSGNVIFDRGSVSVDLLTTDIESAIESAFGFEVRVLLRDLPTLRRLVEAMPADWVNDDTMKCDVMFLFDGLAVEELPAKPDIDHLIVAPGAIIWRVDRHDVTRSGMMKIAGTPIYKRMTIRNCNTVRNLMRLMES